jgi:hypothetical protein
MICDKDSRLEDGDVQRESLSGMTAPTPEVVMRVVDEGSYLVNWKNEESDAKDWLNQEHKQADEHSHDSGAKTAE